MTSKIPMYRSSWSFRKHSVNPLLTQPFLNFIFGVGCRNRNRDRRRDYFVGEHGMEYGKVNTEPDSDFDTRRRHEIKKTN